MVEVVLRTEKGRRSSPRIKFITLLLPALVSPVYQKNLKQRDIILSGARKKLLNVLPVKGKKRPFFLYWRGEGGVGKFWIRLFAEAVNTDINRSSKENNCPSPNISSDKATFVWPWNENARTNRKNKRTEIQQFDWFIERIQTRVAFGWLSERSAEKTSCPRTC